jgi:ADP-ribosyl-[dinitrogen reductase] hydrolase
MDSTMLGAVAGDIIGSRFEGHPSPPCDFELFHPDCRFTDDTVCALAVADALLGGLDFAGSLRTFVRRHPGRGYGGMFLQWAFTEGAPAYGSWGNGAPMRVPAVGWLAKKEDDLIELAKAQASVSHNHPDAIAAAQAVALAIFLARHGMPRDSIRRNLMERFGYDLTPERVLVGGHFDVSAAGTVKSALAAALESEDWESGVRAVICLGGDTDTLACITGAVAEAIHGIPAEVADAARSYLTEDLMAVLTGFELATGRSLAARTT